MSGALKLDPCIGYLLMSAYALLFAWAAYLKLRDLRAFTAVLDHYELVPPVLLPVAARLVPLCEAAIAMLLLLPHNRASAAIMGSGMCLLYAVAIGVNLRRGRRDLDCGCLGALKRRPISGWMFWRNLALAAALLIICSPWSSRALNGIDLLTIGAGAVGIALLYVTLDSLMAIILRAESIPATP